MPTNTRIALTPTRSCVLIKIEKMGVWLVHGFQHSGGIMKRTRNFERRWLKSSKAAGKVAMLGFFAIFLGSCTSEIDPPRRYGQALFLPGGEVDCSQVHEALARVRTSAEQSAADLMAAKLRAESPHLDVPTTELVGYFAPAPGLGRPTDPSAAAEVDLIVKFLLCDKLTREVVTQQYLGDHPGYRQ